MNSKKADYLGVPRSGPLDLLSSACAWNVRRVGGSCQPPSARSGSPIRAPETSLHVCREPTPDRRFTVSRWNSTNVRIAAVPSCGPLDGRPTQ